MMLFAVTAITIFACGVVSHNHFSSPESSLISNSTGSNSMTLINPQTTSNPICCSLDGDDFTRYVWGWKAHGGTTIDVTVATISTLVTQYNNTAITAYQTVTVDNYDASLPRPLAIIIRENNFTDPYGVVHQPPIPFIRYDGLNYSSFPSDTGTCEYGQAPVSIKSLQAPSPGFYVDDKMDKDGFWTFKKFVSWMEFRLPPDSAGIPSSFGQCITAGAPFRGGNSWHRHYTAVNILTVEVSVTSTIPGVFGGGTESAPPSGETYVSSPQPAPMATTSLPGPTPAPTNEISGLPRPAGPDQGGQPTSSNPSQASSLPAVIPIITVGGAAYTQNSASEFVIAYQTLTPGGIITAHHSTVSLMVGGEGAVINGITHSFQPVPLMTIGPSTYTANLAGDFVIAGQTLEIGTAITANGTAISLAPGGSAVVVNGVTQTIPNLGPVTSLPHFITVNSTAYTADANGDFVIGGQTIHPGDVVTADGITISLALGGSIAVVNGTTQTIENSATAMDGRGDPAGGFVAQTGSSSPNVSGGLSSISRLRRWESSLIVAAWVCGWLLM